jgi:AraC-like DNA-binding protein
MMPELDGMELCKQLKGSIETSHIPIILLTAKSEMDSRIEGLDVGAESYITKPFHPKHLLVRVARLIELRDLLKGRYSKKISLGDISGTPSTSPDELFMQKAIRIILDKMADSEFNGDLLAGEMGVSRMGLHRKIKAMTGQSTGEFIRNIRLKKAAELLKVQGRNVSEVCYDVGFSSPSYFTTCFAEVYKMTPSEYMKQFKEEN